MRDHTCSILYIFNVQSFHRHSPAKHCSILPLLLAVDKEIIEQIELSLLSVSGRYLDQRTLLDPLVAGIHDVRPLPLLDGGLPVGNLLEMLYSSLRFVDGGACFSHHCQRGLSGVVVRVTGWSVLLQLLRGEGRGWGREGGEKEGAKEGGERERERKRERDVLVCE